MTALQVIEALRPLTLLATLLLAGPAGAQAPASEPATATFPPTDDTLTAPPSTERGAPVVAGASAAVPPPEPPRRLSHAADDDADLDADAADRSASEPPDSKRAAAAARGPALPIFGVGMGFGAAFGGETLLSAVFSDGSRSDLNAGTGISLSARAFVSPIWIADTVGLGLGLDFGWKYAAIGVANVSVSLIRFPLLVTGRVLLRATDGVMLLAAGGIQYEGAPTVSASGATQAELKFDAALGGTFEGGLLIAQAHIGFEATVRHTWLTYGFMGAHADAGHTGIFSGFFYVL